MAAKMRRKAAALIVSMALAVSVCSTCAAASDGWFRAGQALGLYAVYKQTLTEMLRLGNDPAVQEICRLQDIKENGADKNELDVRTVNNVMERLTHQGEYVLKVNSLPFVWAVNDSAKFNASCYPTNYISINRGLVRGLNLDEDKLAAVLAHEMTHGLEQHSAHKYAQVQAEVMGMTMLGMETGQADWRHFQGLIGYSVAKDIMSPAEVEADAGGFWLMTSAGFNPGGPAAAMAEMSDYMRYRTRDIYEFESSAGRRPDEWSDHPETEAREQNLSELLTLYSAGHVRVKNRREVWVDDTLLYTAEANGENLIRATERAYYVAGGLAKAFHDLPSPAEWNFRTDNRRVIFLSDNPVYAPLREALLNDGEKLAAAVESAYAGEKTSNRRQALLNAEAKMRDKWNKVRQTVLTADTKFADALRQNSDAYVDLGYADLAQTELNRAQNHPAQNNPAECYLIAGRIHALNGDYAAALASAGQGLALDDKNYMNYLNLSDIYHKQGDFAQAIKAAEYARTLKEDKISVALCAELYDETGQKDRAGELYAKLYRWDSAWYIPYEYLVDIDAGAAQKMRERERNRTEKK